MKKLTGTVLILVLLLFGLSRAQAQTIELLDWGFNIDGTTYCSSVDCDNMGELSLPASINVNNFDIGIGLSGLGTIEITISGIGSHFVVTFLDHDIDFLINGPDNETATAVNLPVATGQTWEIDEPGFGSLQNGDGGLPYVGDIFDNFLDYRTVHPTYGLILLDNQIFYNLEDDQTILIPVDDVSMGMGWDFELLAGETAKITLTLSDVTIPSGFYLKHSDPDSVADIYFSSSLDIIGTTIIDDLIVDFGPADGIWVRYDDGSWEQLHGLSPEIMVVGDIDGNGLDDLVVDFGATYGIWVRYDDGSWEQLHGLSPEIMVVGDIDGNGLDDLVVDFGATYGIWVRYDDGSWAQLHGLSPEIMVVGDIDGDGLDDLVVDFGATYGIWVRYDDGSWEQLHGLSPEIMVVGDIDGDGLDDLVVDFGATYGIWVRYDDGSWAQLHGLSPEIMVVGDIDGNGLDDLVVDFGATYGIWVRYDDGSWEQLHGLSPEIMVVGDIDGNGLDDLVVDFGATYGIWVRYDDGSWEQLHGLSPEIMTVGDVNGS